MGKNGACVFLDALGCGVYPDRPLVCRLYPLGRHILTSGEESFSEIEPDRKCKGVYGDDGMIMDYLDIQEARSFMEAADRYLALLERLCRILEEETAEPEAQAAVAGLFQKLAAGECYADIGFADVDAIVDAFCEKLCMPVPTRIEDKMSIHIQAVEAWADSIRRTANHEAKKTKRAAGKGPEKKAHPTGD